MVTMHLFFCAINFCILLCAYVQSTPSHPINTNEKENTIIISMSPPRSLSTAFLRLFESRGDFNCFNEPSIYFSRHKKADPIIQQVTKGVKQSHIFLKEISSPIHNIFTTREGIDLLQQKNVYTIFLVRNPHHTIVSLYKKTPNILKAGFYEILYESMYLVLKTAVNKPIIVLSEDLYTNPEKIYQSLCARCNLDYVPEALSWQPESFETKHTDWNNTERAEKTFNLWHSDALESTGIHTPSTYDTRNDGSPSFIEINTKHRDLAFSRYHECLAIYRKIQDHFSDYIVRINE